MNKRKHEVDENKEIFEKDYHGYHRSDFHVLCHSNAIDEVKTIITRYSSKSADIFASSEFFNNVMTQAVRDTFSTKNYQLLKVLLETSKCIWSRDIFKLALDLAFDFEDEWVVNYFLQLRNVNGEPPFDLFRTPVNLCLKAVEKKSEKVLKMLLADERAEPGLRHNEALTAAIEQSSLNLVIILLRHPRVNPLEYNFILIEWMKKFNSDELWDLVFEHPVIKNESVNFLKYLFENKDGILVERLFKSSQFEIVKEEYSHFMFRILASSIEVDSPRFHLAQVMIKSQFFNPEMLGHVLIESILSNPALVASIGLLLNEAQFNPFSRMFNPDNYYNSGELYIAKKSNSATQFLTSALYTVAAINAWLEKGGQSSSLVQYRTKLFSSIQRVVESITSHMQIYRNVMFYKEKGFFKNWLNGKQPPHEIVNKIVFILCCKGKLSKDAESMLMVPFAKAPILFLSANRDKADVAVTISDNNIDKSVVNVRVNMPQL